MNEYLGYPLFNKLRKRNLRTFNRVNVFLNIKERHGSVLANRYLTKIDRDGQIDIYKMMKRINKDGFEQVRRDLNRGEFV